MSLSLINIDTTFFKGCLDILYRPRFRVDFVTRLSYLAARPSQEPRPLEGFLARPNGPPSQETGRRETKHFVGMA